MIWSIVPESMIFPAPAEEAAAQVATHCGRTVLVRAGRVVTLLSSNPEDFLDTRFMPGALVQRKF